MPSLKTTTMTFSTLNNKRESEYSTACNDASRKIQRHGIHLQNVRPTGG